MVVLFWSQRHSITLILLQEEEGRERGKGKKGGRGPKHLPARPAGWAAPSGVVLSDPGPSGHPRRPRPPRPRPGPLPRARGPSSGARRPRCPALVPPSLAPSRPPRLRQIKQLPLRPSARASQRGGRWGRGGGGSGPAGSPPPRRPAGCPAWPPALQLAGSPWRGRGPGGGEGKGQRWEGEVLNSFGEGVGRRSRLGRNREGLMGRGLRERSQWLLGPRGS